jgi:hypothetical protein
MSLVNWYGLWNLGIRMQVYIILAKERLIGMEKTLLVNG